MVVRGEVKCSLHVGELFTMESWTKVCTIIGVERSAIKQELSRHFTKKKKNIWVERLIRKTACNPHSHSSSFYL